MRRGYDAAGCAPRSKGSAGGLCGHRHARCVPKALNAPMCAQYTKCTKYAKWRNLSVAALILGARSPRTRPRARARAILKNHATHFSPTEILEQKFDNLLLMCAQWTHLGGVIFHFFEKPGFFEKISDSQHTLSIPSAYSQHTLSILSTYSQHILNILSTYSQHTLNVLSTYSHRTLNGAWPRQNPKNVKIPGSNSSKRRQVICRFCATLRLGSILQSRFWSHLSPGM